MKLIYVLASSSNNALFEYIFCFKIKKKKLNTLLSPYAKIKDLD